MFVFTTLLSAAIGIQAVIASPIQARTPYRVKETHTVPRKWEQLDRAPGSRMIHMQIGLKQSQFDELERHLYEGITKPSGTYRRSVGFGNRLK
jgi:tripeptidyl-peptidase I